MKSVLIFLAVAAALIAAPASPVSVSSVSRSGNVVTVTCAAPCGIVANQGFQLSGVTDTSFNGNGTAVSGSGSTFTFNQTGANASSSGGQVLPAKKVIILSVLPSVSGIQVSALCWITTVAGITVSSGSAWSGASAAEVAAINAGNVQEKALTPIYGNGTTKASIQTDLQNQCSTLQSTLTNAAVQPGQFTGGYFDGAGWSF